ALNHLAYTFAEHEMRLDEAEQLARKALSLQPGDGYIMDTLGWVLFKRGDLAQALKVLEAAYRAQSGESVIAEHLGDAYYRLQNFEDAMKMYMKAAEIADNSKDIEKLRQKISQIQNQIMAARNPARRRSQETDRLPASGN